MYKLLLSWRYLKTRFIALASVVSVTLGVATLIVVNSVMAGFVDQMKNRLHGILSDVEIAAPIMSEIVAPHLFEKRVREVVGDDLQDLTCVVRSNALLSFDFHGRQWTQHVMLLGIDDETFGKVTDFEPYLTNELKRQRFSFDLEESGYHDFELAGWPYRRQKIEEARRIEQLMLEQQQMYDSAAESYFRENAGPDSQETTSGASEDDADLPQFAPIPSQVPDLAELYPAVGIDPESSPGAPITQLPAGQVVQLNASDPHADRREKIDPSLMFDPLRDQRTGIILGLAISKRKMKAADGSITDIHMVRPGDDVQLTFLSAGGNARAVIENFTVADFYSSNMHEYDSSFAFIPLSEMQKLRGMIDPVTGVGSVTAIQMKLRPGANLDEVRDKLIAAFPSPDYVLDIHTWQDTQRPLLSAVQMELTILNILLFLIIAVAGFGILATFFMIVVEKTRDIGILKALGAPSHGVMSIFLGYGMSLGTVGTGVGIGLGLLFVLYINEIADVVGWITGQEVFDPTIYYFSEIPTIVSPWMVLFVGTGAILIAVLASVLPALRAARLHPVEALRYE